MIVVDTNIIGYLYLTGERSEQAERAYRKDPQWAAPLLWRSELQNVLATYLHKNLLSVRDAHQIILAAAGLLAGREYEVPALPVLRLAAESACSAYDCEFVALALELQVPLVTVDRQVLAEFPSTAVSLDRFI